MDDKQRDNQFETVGNLHIHSVYSDGAGSVADIARSAGKAGLNFIILNDHNYMTNTLHLEDEGIYDGVYVLMGLEIGKRFHHYLAFDLPGKVKTIGLRPQGIIDRVNQEGGFGFLAHPFEKGMPFRENSIAYTWNDTTVTGYAGICIWNFSSRWKEQVKSPLHGLFFLLFKAWMLKGPSRETLDFWDDQCRHRNVVAIGGSDAHGSLFKWGPFRFVPLSYDYTVNSINVHLLLNHPLPRKFREAKKQIYKAIRQGRLFIAHERLAPAVGFRFSYIDRDGSCLTMGEEAEFKLGTLFVEIPEKGEIWLLKDGVFLKKWAGKRASYQVEERGVYRVAVYRRVPFFGLRPWIFSNPIYLR